ncbi:MAG TPA: DinB family protein [Chitinophagaceae bacterium]|nr:DinB family protein [Chitinophagaceae bacterium]
MKELLLDLAAYHYWANQRLLNLSGTLTDEQLDRPTRSSFSSLRGTWYHLWDAEAIWMQRLQLADHVMLPSKGFSGSFQEFIPAYLQANQTTESFVARQSEPGLSHVVEYYNSRKEHFKSPVYQCLIQVFNHGSYHRGQAVTILRELGQERIPGTDYIGFKRRKK